MRSMRLDGKNLLFGQEGCKVVVGKNSKDSVQEFKEVMYEQRMAWGHA